MPSQRAKREPLEATKTANIIKYLNGIDGVYAFKYVGSPYTKRGIPDIICCYKGLFVALEVKRHEGDDARKQQKQRILQIRQARGLALVVHSVDEVRAIVSELDRNIEGQLQNGQV